MNSQSPNSSSKSRKRRQRDDDDDEESPADTQLSESDQSSISLENNLQFSDTMVALQIMRAQFPRIDKVSIHPFILRSQLYSSVKDRTQVDRDLESLRREKILRIFKLNTGQDDHAVMFMDDYLNQCSLLAMGGNVTDEDISLLVNAGLLTRQLIDPNTYWFAIPNIGSVLKGLSQGRKELLSLLNRRKYKEMMLAHLEKKRLHLSPLDMRFHLRDLLGSGKLKSVQTASGLVIRVAKD